ncbi:MAG: response regulator [Pseudomonadales bacterium]
MKRLYKKMSFKWFAGYFGSVLTAGIGRSLFIRFLITSILPMSFVAFVSIQNSVETITKNQTDALVAVAKAKHDHLSAYFKSTITNIRLQAELENTVSYMEALKAGYQHSGQPLNRFTKSFQWANFEEQYGADLSHFLLTYSYIDILLLDDKGNILYSIRRDDDLGRNLFEGKYAQSKFSLAVKKSLKTGVPVYSDIEIYPPYNNQLSSFLMQTVVDEYGDKLGVLVIHLSNGPISEIIGGLTGFGELSQTYLVGQDLLMRSNSKFFEQSTILSTQVDTLATQNWFKNLQAFDRESEPSGFNINDHSSEVYLDYRGVKVFGAQRPIEFAGIPMLMVAELSESEALLPVRELLDRVAVIVLATMCLTLLVSIFSVRSITRPIIQLTSWARQLAVGHLEIENIETPNNEIGILNRTFVDLVDSLQEITGIMESLSVGDLSKEVSPRSDNDILVLALIQLSSALEGVVLQAELIAGGNLEVDIEPRSDRDLLGNALSRMTENLRKAEQESAQQDWVKTSQAELAEVLSGDDKLSSLSNKITTYLVKRLQGLVGLLYVVDADAKRGSLSLIGRYAFDSDSQTKQSLEFGEGLLGQSAIDKEIILLKEPPDDYLNVNSALGESAASNVLIIPFVLNDQLKAVIEIGGFIDITDVHMEFVRLASESIAVAIDSCVAHRQTHLLLEETQRQSETLKTQQEELSATNKELTSKSHSLLKQQIILKQAQKETEEKATALESASKYKSEFLANMSHELRTPLNSLLILARLLVDNEDDNLSEDEVESAKIIQASGQDLLELINEILDLSKVEAGQMVLHAVEVHIAEFAVSMNSRFKHMAKEKCIDFDTHLADDLPDVLVSDHVKLGQIMTNLLSNAIKFTDQGSVVLDISVKHSRGLLAGHDKVIAFSVIDTGLGIAEDKQTFIFEAFQQADGSTSRTHGGTGLGLSIALSFARLLGGDIQLKSSLGVGSTFNLYLPVKPHEVEGLDLPGVSSTGDSKPLGRIEENPLIKPFSPKYTPPPFEDDRHLLEQSKALLLIIEDDQHFSKILFEACHKQNCQAIVAPDGETGLTLASEYDVRGILLDYMLPGIDGADILAHLSSSPETNDIPIHVLSAVDYLGDMRALGAVGQATKPVSSAELKVIITSMTGDVGQQVNLLLVEDDVATVYAIKKLLESENVLIRGVKHGLDGLKLLRQRSFDGIILDLGLPDISGFEFLDVAAEDDDVFLPPLIIIYSGKELSDVDQQRLAFYTGTIITKSALSADILLEAVRKFASQLASVKKNSQKNLRSDKSPSISVTTAVVESVPNSSATPISALSQSENTSSHSNKTLLLVDDDMRNTFALAKVLRKKGFKVRLASSGQQSLDMLDEHTDIDLVLMDIMMPEMDGYEAMERIRQKEQFENLLIIAVTANAMQGDREKCIEAGASDYLSKPVDLDDLSLLFNKWL